MIPVGHLKQKASPYLTLFVLWCAVMITGILFMKERAEALRDTLNPNPAVYEYFK